jgi:hypothetical protein
VRVAVRQVRDLVARLIWRLDLPSGFESSATSLVVHNEVRSRAGLEELDRLVAAGVRVDPARVTLSEPEPGVLALDAGGEPSVYVGPLAVDLVRDAAARTGSAELRATNVTGVALAGALDAFVAAGSGELEGRVETGAAPGAFLLSARTQGHVPPRAGDDVPQALLERGLEIPDALWDRLFALSLDVLLNVDRRPDPEEDPE